MTAPKSLADQPCGRCGRIRHRSAAPDGTCRVAKVRVVHSFYGCDTGCCGHKVLFLDADCGVISSEFDFSHPYREEKREFVLNLARQYVNDETLIDVDGSEALDD